MNNYLRDSIANIIWEYRSNRHLLDISLIFKYKRMFRRQYSEKDLDYYYRVRQGLLEMEKELVCPVTNEEELNAYRNLLSFMELHINYTMNHDAIGKAIQLIGAWGRSLRAGNGEIPWWENERMRNNVIRKMGEIKSGK